MSKRILEITLVLLIGVNISLLVTVIVNATKSNICRSFDGVMLNARIVGGQKLKIESFPFVAAIVIKKHNRLPRPALQCGCSIISKYWVLSAAHCVWFIKKNKIEWRYVVISSNSKEWKKGVEHQVVKMLVNKNFVQKTLAHDTSLFKVEKPFTLTNEVPIMLAGVNYKYEVNKTATIVGWGYNSTEGTAVQEALLGVNVTIFSNEYCEFAYPKKLTLDMVCAGSYKGGKDACVFDSGGPIVVDNVLIGIVSWGEECGNYMQPGVYAKVSYAHSWFKEVELEEKEKIGFTIKT